MTEPSTSSVWLESPNGESVPVRGRCFLGRSPACEVVLPDVKVSRQHALVQGQDEMEFWLIDLGSANGTYLNDRRVQQPCRLSNGDRIGVAEFTFTFHGPTSREPLEPAFPSADATEATVHAVRSFMCWLLVADIEGSTQLLQKLPAEEAPRVTGRWITACRKILEQEHGTINKFLGDGFVAYWPAGPECNAWVARALQALKKLQEEGPTQFRIVLHYGRVLAGGAASMGEESLLGNEVNFVFRVEKLAASIGEFRLLSEPAQAALGPLLGASPAGQHAVHGFTGEFAFYTF
jgi:adenylate cyclase